MKIKNIIRGTLLGMLVFIGSFSFVMADNTPYTVLAPLPGTTIETPNGTCTPKPDGTGCTSTLKEYLPGLFNLMIGVGAVAAFVVITIYGLELMLTDSLPTKTNAKSMIENALWGLGLIIFAYVILYTINPNLLNGSLNITTPTIATGDTVGSAPFINPCADPASASCSSDKTTRASLTNNTGITVAPACNGTQASGCTNLNGVTPAAVNGTVSLQKACGCVVITGATEHQVGSAIDMASNATLNTYVTGSGTITSPPTQSITKTLPNGQTATFTYEYAGQVSTLATGGTVTASGNHWHVSF